MLVETHIHTTYSQRLKILYEGLSTPAEMIKAAARQGIGALAITDHDSFKGVAVAKKASKGSGVLIIPGQEISSSDGHIIALGISEEIKKGMAAEDTIDEIRSQGGICIAPHPFDIGRFGIKTKARLCDAVEVFNSMNLDRIANIRSHDWVTKNNLIPAAGSDAHNTQMLGLGSLVMRDDHNSVDSILKAIKKGRHGYHARYAPTSVMLRWAVDRMKLSREYTMEYIMSNYSEPKKSISTWLLNSTKHSPGRIDYFYQILAYIGIGSSVIYSATRGRRVMHM